MKPPSTTPPDAPSAANAQLWFQAACLFAVAVALGVFYNGTSPLGVRPQAVATLEAGRGAPGGAAAKPALARQGFSNETLALTLEPVAGNAPLPRGSNPAPVAAAPQPEIPTLSWPQVRPLLEARQIVLVDARAKAAYDLGHIPGAVWLSSTAPLTELEAFAAQYGKDTALVTYCGSTTCRASQHLARQLLAMGRFQTVSEMPGGFAEYTLAQTSPPQTQP